MCNLSIVFIPNKVYNIDINKRKGNIKMKSNKVEITDNKIIFKLDKYPVPPAARALRENGFKYHKGIWVAKKTPQNEFFIKLLA